MICKHNRETLLQGNYNNLYREKLQGLLKLPTIVFPYYVYKFSLKRLWGSPITFKILPITIKDFSHNVIVVSLLQCFPIIFTSMDCTFPVNSCKHLQCMFQTTKAGINSPSTSIQAASICAFNLMSNRVKSMILYYCQEQTYLLK